MHNFAGSIEDETMISKTKGQHIAENMENVNKIIK